MSPRYFIDYDDSRVFVSFDKLDQQILNLIKHVKECYNIPSQNLDLVSYTVKQLVEKEHNAVIIGGNVIRIGKVGLQSAFVFDTMSDFTMFMLRWS
jgi:hypothetical protein